MANNNFFALAALQTKESMEALHPGQIFNAYAFETMFRRKGVEFTKAFLDQIIDGVGLFHDNNNNKIEVLDMNNKIAELNDKLRQNIFNPGKDQVFLTRSFSNLSIQEECEIMNKVKNFNNFTSGDDPFGHHDFGGFEHNDVLYFFKIDYYDNTLKYLSKDPSNPDITTRVLTIMRADEY